MRRARRITAGAICVGLLAAACASTPSGPPPVATLAPPPPPPPRPPTPAELLAAEFAWSTRAGSNAITGSVVYKASGRGWTCAGQSVALAPETRTSAEHMRALYGSTEQAVQPVAAVRARNAQAPGVDFGPWVRSTVCDARSSFGFRNLPDGAFYVIARARARTKGGAADAGLVFMQRVEVKGGGAREIVLPQRARPR